MENENKEPAIMVVEESQADEISEHRAFMQKFNKDLIVIMIRHIFIFTVIFWLTSVYLTSRENDLKHDAQITELQTRIDGLQTAADGMAMEIDHYHNDIHDLQVRLKDAEDIIEIQGRELESVSNDLVYLIEIVRQQRLNTTYQAVLTQAGGVAFFEGHRETWYNLDMSDVVSTAKSSIPGMEDAEYWVRDDGVKMLGDYIMVAANYDIHPYGTTVNTSLGEGIVVDWGPFVYIYPTQIDIAVDWRG